MQADPEASIRTNTCILIGRLAPSLSNMTRSKMLVPAFTRALKDPFVHCRVAGLMAFTATTELFDIEELATRALPAICPVLIDKEKYVNGDQCIDSLLMIHRLVREQASKTVDLFVKRLQTHAASMVPITFAHVGTNKSHSNFSPKLHRVRMVLR
jgi:SCY1-like protein 1